MSDSSGAAAVYRGTGLTCCGWAAVQEAAEDRNANPHEADMTAGTGGDVRLEGKTGETGGLGNKPGDRVANLRIEHHSRPARTRSLPADHRTNQSALSRGRGK